MKNDRGLARKADKNKKQPQSAKHAAKDLPKSRWILLIMDDSHAHPFQPLHQTGAR